MKLLFIYENKGIDFHINCDNDNDSNGTNKIVVKAIIYIILPIISCNTGANDNIISKNNITVKWIVIMMIISILDTDDSDIDNNSTEINYIINEFV